MFSIIIWNLIINYLKFHLHAIQKWASLFQRHPREYISKICSFSNRIFEIKRINYALDGVIAPFLNMFFHFSCLIFGKNQLNKRSATFIWAVGTPHYLEFFICHSASVVLVCLSVPNHCHRSSCPTCPFVPPQVVIPHCPQKSTEQEHDDSSCLVHSAPASSKVPVSCHRFGEIQLEGI